MGLLTRGRAAVLLLTVAGLSGACRGGPADEVLVLHTADSYGYFDDCGCRADSTGGLAKRAWVIDSLRRVADAPILLVDAGDFTGGDNAYGGLLGGVMIDAMKLMGYDAFTFGEWDFNQGTAYLRDVVASSGIAWVHTNYDVVGLEGLGQRTLVVEKGGRRIGLIGLYNPTILLNPSMRDSVVVRDIVESAQAAVADLRRQGVDAIVALSHLSYSGDRALAFYVDGIDLVVNGHGGKSLVEPEKVADGTWIVASGDLGRYLGRADLHFAPGDSSGVSGVTGGLMVMEPGLPDDPRLKPLFERYEEERKALLKRELGARRPGPPQHAEPRGEDRKTRPLEPPQS